MSTMVEWKEKKTSLGNAIIIGAVMLVIGVVIGISWNSIIKNFGPYLGIDSSSTTAAT